MPKTFMELAGEWRKEADVKPGHGSSEREHNAAFATAHGYCARELEELVKEWNLETGNHILSHILGVPKESK
jgi:hypothetical protein